MKSSATVLQHCYYVPLFHEFLSNLKIDWLALILYMFGMTLVQISARKSAILTEVCRRFCQSVHAKFVVLPKIVQ